MLATSGKLKSVGKLKSPKPKPDAHVTELVEAKPALLRPALVLNIAWEMGELLEIDLDQVQPSPDNPRKSFNPIAMAELSESIRTIGILQPLLVGRCGGIFELVAGHRRYRAAEMSGLKRVPCYVRDLTPEQVTIARLAENLAREDLNAIEEAYGYQFAMERHGWTQVELQSETGVSQGQISNRLRLLNLPDRIQQHVISAEMTASQARDLVPFAEFPAFFSELEKLIKKDLPKDLTPRVWSECVSKAVNNSSEKISGYHSVNDSYVTYDFSKLGKAKLEELQTKDVQQHWGKERRVFNLKLFKELVTAEAARQKEQSAKKLAKEVDGKKKTDRKPTAEELKKLAEQHNKRLYRHKVKFLQSKIATRLDQLEQEDFLVLMTTLAMTGSTQVGKRSEMFEAALKTAGGEPPEKGASDWSIFLSIDRQKLPAVMTTFFQLWCSLEARSWSSDAHPLAIESVASILGIDLSLWRVSEEFLVLHTSAQLEELIAEWKILNLQGKTKSGLVKSILQHDLGVKLAPPKELLSVKPTILD